MAKWMQYPRNILKKIQKLGMSPEQSEIKYLLSHGLRLGKNVRIHAENAFDSVFPWLIVVGNNVCISSDVKILAHDTSTEYVCGYTKIGQVVIGDNVYIGYGAIILCNTRIGNNTIIGAGSVVSGNIPPDSVYAGDPAHFICSLEDFKRRHQEQLENAPRFEGPCQKWREAPPDQKQAMYEKLNGRLGYMK
ncbi:MAG: acyltransferase [Gemmiger sp.]|uniref:acyltransferase n=1 Tax=Gemmiger sp. TaxID=2049027 RepID=UPI002E79962A|nr:acyltransferase [Gemmiger sp.]MEE0799900.1 acyltransferase [Gemmiger sp.]